MPKIPHNPNAQPIVFETVENGKYQFEIVGGSQGPKAGRGKTAGFENIDLDVALFADGRQVTQIKANLTWYLPDESMPGVTDADKRLSKFLLNQIECFAVCAGYYEGVGAVKPGEQPEICLYTVLGRRGWCWVEKVPSDREPAQGETKKFFNNVKTWFTNEPKLERNLDRIKGLLPPPELATNNDSWE